MENTKKIVQAALASVVALSALGVTQQAVAAEAYVKCYGVAAAGKNDCGAVGTACAATIKQDRACYAWIYVPEGICKKIAGACVGKPSPNCKGPDGKPVTG